MRHRKKDKKDKKQLAVKPSTKKSTGATLAKTENRTASKCLPHVESSSSIKSSVISSLFLLSMTLIILALPVIIGLVSYVYSYNFSDNAAERFGFKASGENNIADSENARPSDKNPPISPQSKAAKGFGQNPKKTGKVIRAETYENWANRALLKRYQFDFEEAMKLRNETMKRYSYPYSAEGIDKRTKLSLQEYYDVYDGKWPVIISDIIPTWPASNWSVATLKQKYGEARVAMATFNIKNEDNYKPQKEGYSVPLGLFLENLNFSREVSWTYVQDELFLVQFPELRSQVLDNMYSGEDFFNLFPREIRPWDCLFLWGTAYSRSTLHVDPYNWTGTNAVIYGQKRWRLFLPGQDHLLSISPDGSCGFPLECQKYNSVYDTYLNTDKMKRRLKKLKYIEFDQMSGEMLFIPTGWFHQAYNVVPTLAVSGEIMNRNNYLSVLEEIFKVGNVPRSVLPKHVEDMTPQQLVTFVMSKIPSHIVKKGAEWTKYVMKSLLTPVPADEFEN